jgi:hypothetical protein
LNIDFFLPSARYCRAFPGHCARLQEALKPNFPTESRNLFAAGIAIRLRNEKIEKDIESIDDPAPPDSMRCAYSVPAVL